MRSPTPQQKWRSSLALLLIIGLIIAVFMLGQTTTQPQEEVVDLNRFVDYLRQGLIATVKIQETETEATLRGSRKVLRLKAPRSLMEDKIVPILMEKGPKNPQPPEVTFDVGSGFWSSFLLSFGLPLIVIVVIWILLMRSFRGAGGTGGILHFARAKAKLASKEKVKVTFDDVAGMEEAKEEVQEIIEFLMHPAKFRRMGARIPRGVLLVGPPGCGKTLLAKAVAGEAGVPFLSISGSDFVEMFVGVGASRVRDLFQRAKQNAPSIIFLDEIDAIGRKRGVGIPGGGQDERESTLNAILVEMDGFETDEGIVVMAATNRPDMLDPALLRPGRFDKIIHVDLPDVKGREEILKVHAKKVRMREDVDLSVIARTTPMFSGAELEALINEAALIAVARGKDAVDMECLEEARDKVRWGRQRRSRVMAEEEKRLAAYHEAGHTIASIKLPLVDKLHKVTIIPRGPMLGGTMLMPRKDIITMSRKKALEELTLLLAGRAAEEFFLNDLSSGASNDIQRATEIARLMVCEWGMSEKLGPVRYGITQQQMFLGTDFTGKREFSDETAREIDQEVHSIIDSCYKHAMELIKTNKDKVELLAKALMQFEVLNAEEVDRLFEAGSLDAIKKEQKSETAAAPERSGSGNDTKSGTDG